MFRQMAFFSYLYAQKTERMKHRKAILPLISAIILIFASCRERYRTADGSLWGTSYHVVYGGSATLADSIAAVGAEIDTALSLFNPQSELCAVNAGDSIVSGHFCRVFDISQRISSLSSGAYDPTVAPLTALWGFGAAGSGKVPSDSAVAAAVATVGINRCSIGNGILTRGHACTQFDFSSVAKGYGVDCIADMLERNGVTDYMVEVGGEVVARGFSPRGDKWRIQVDSPLGGMAHTPLLTVALGPGRSSLASSGNYRNIRTDASTGRMWAHTISPRSGLPVQSPILAASVRADACAVADALATACMASGNVDSAMAIVRRAGAEAIVVYASGDTISTVRTPHFDL